MMSTVISSRYEKAPIHSLWGVVCIVLRVHSFVRLTITDSFTFSQVDEPNTGGTIKLINAYGELKDWTTETVEVPTEGMYKFVCIRSVRDRKKEENQTREKQNSSLFSFFFFLFSSRVLE